MNSTERKRLFIAFENRKAIQIKNKSFDKWEDFENESDKWDFKNFDYREKPEPEFDCVDPIPTTKKELELIHKISCIVKHKKTGVIYRSGEITDRHKLEYRLFNPINKCWEPITN